MPRHPNTRRDVLKGLAAGAAGLAAASAVPAEAGVADSGLSPAPRRAADRSWSLLAPVGPGDHLGFGWHAGRLQQGDGAWTLSLVHAELGVARVAICYHQGAPRGLASTELLDLVLMDGGTGDRRTEESVGRVILALCRVLARNELAAAADFPHLMTHAERVERFGPEQL